VSEQETDPELLAAIDSETYGAARCDCCGYCFWAVGMDDEGPWRLLCCPECGEMFDLGEPADAYYSLALEPR
jgi:hypothetical protein